MARKIFCGHCYFRDLAIALVPKMHPWRTLMESARTDICELTQASLYPRGASRQPSARLPRPARKQRRVLVVAVLAFLTLEATAVAVPGPIGKTTGSDDAIRIIQRTSAAAAAFVQAN